MTELQKYIPFSTFVFRTPFFTFEEYLNNINKLNDDKQYWTEFLSKKVLQESIYLASPILYDEIKKYLNQEIKKEKDIIKLKNSVLRYYTRMSTRCTPFGLFAGVSLGKISNSTNLRIVEPKQYLRNTRLDMNYFCNLVLEISKMKEVRSRLKYYPNTTINNVGDRIRYVEYSFEKTKREHKISEIDYNNYIDTILLEAKHGATIKVLGNKIIEEDISLDEALDFIDILIDNQILVSEIEPSVTGDDFLSQLYIRLKDIPDLEDISSEMYKILELLSEIDKSEVGMTIENYKEIEEIIKGLKVNYDKKYLFQTDMYKPTIENGLNNNLLSEIFGALRLMNKLSIKGTETSLAKFVESYTERYEEKEMPLLTVLDSEMGIGYGSNNVDISPMLDGLVFPNRQSNVNNIQWNRISSILNKKRVEAFKTDSFIVEITDDDFDFLNENWNDLPDTISCMCEIFSNKENHPLLYIHSAGGTSAANLLGRFCHVSKEFKDHVIGITSFEKEQNKDAICAEIVHLPESRIGNILARPILREYEIPYLAKSSVDIEHQILLSDLYISVKRGKILLRSKRLNKEVIPYLSTAHNYSFKSMPIYHFLCDLQAQGLRKGIGFYWDNLSNESEFLPRVEYKSIILSLARWIIKTKEIKELLIDFKIEKVKKWQESKRMPNYVMLADGDNELFVDFSNIISLEMLYSVIKKREQFILNEFPFDKNNSIITNEQNTAFVNEFIFSLKKESIK